ncbi:MAG: MMPL family transporter [Actinobacteria bacterium]|jgi:RND superfamily putative drug exporter|nr:MMPL family transporter [Actinomycetota bacterium]
MARSSHPDERVKIPFRVTLAAIAMILVWFGLGGVGGQAMGGLSELQENSAASFLPEDAESTVVANALADFQDSTALPLIIVAARDGGLQPDDLGRAQALAKELPGTSTALSDGSTIADFLATPPQVPLTAVPSQDGQALLLVLPLNADKISEKVGEDIALKVVADDIREAVASQLGDAGMTAYVTGPAGFISDLSSAFGGIDGILLGVALVVVLVILLIVYRSPVLPIAVLLTAVFGLSAAGYVVYRVADAGLITVSGQSQGILSILVVGAATDYALLLVSRYKEELHRHASTWVALKKAWRATVEPITASAATVILGLLALMLADLKSSSGLGPVAALGITGAYLAALTFLPAMLLLGRRWIFWPSVPHVDQVDDENKLANRFGWRRVAEAVGRHPRRTWVGVTIGLLVAAAFLPTLKVSGVAQSDIFLTKVDSVSGQELLAKHFDAGSGSPVLILSPEDKAQDVLAILGDEAGVTQPSLGLTQGPPGAPPKVVDGKVIVQATLSDAIDSPQAVDTVQRIRTDLDRVDPQILVGGDTAQQLDTRTAADRDFKLVAPVILLVVFLVLVALLRSIVAPLILMVANVLSFAAAMGVSAIVFNHVLGFPGGDPTTVLYGFVFLIALGIDYSIFLMTRAREESAHLGARKGVLRALSVTGGVITSAGLVLAATFGALTVIPLIFLAQLAFIVAFGVLLDTLIVRSLLVPALAVDIGPKIWWPAKSS